ncbi:hypothetical protein [Ammonifex degensii]|uniref:hypothetical protein n=1 Tax=Ammonifex degensii TaxID=42838 RepID=UPI00145C57AF|nr:hypothetical protein [Ammonifex degensii]
MKQRYRVAIVGENRFFARTEGIPDFPPAQPQVAHGNEPHGFSTPFWGSLSRL